MQHPTNEQPTRRDFLKTGTAATVAAGLASAASFAPKVYAGQDSTVRVGLIGCGGRGTGAAKQALSTSGPVKLVAMADAFSDQLDRSEKNLSAALEDKADRVAVEPDMKFIGFDAYKQMMDSDVDLVILATPPGFRPIHFEAAVEAGKNVFMEKPVATDAPGVRRVLAANEKAKAKGLAVGVGLQRHHQNNYIETMKRLKDGAIGDIVAMRAYWNSGGVWEPRLAREDATSEMEYQMRNWYYYTWLCGDHICEQHIHNLDVCNWLKDAYPVSCNGMGGREVRDAPRYGQAFDHFAVEYSYDDGSKMFSQCRHIRNCWNSVTEHAHGSNGSADISGAKIEPKDGESWRYRGERNDPYQTEHDDLFAAIRNKTPYNEGDYGAYSTLTAIMGRMATYSGKVVTWEEALNSDISLMPEEYAFDATPPVLPDENGVYPIAVPGVTKTV